MVIDAELVASEQHLCYGKQEEQKQNEQDGAFSPFHPCQY
jgi:hypothetical protein